MTMTDTILFVKETQTCHYVLHIATPRLCGEPGFRSRRDTREEAFVRCREVVASPEQLEGMDRTLPEAPHPFKRPNRAQQQQKPAAVIAPPPVAQQQPEAVADPAPRGFEVIPERSVGPAAVHLRAVAESEPATGLGSQVPHLVATENSADDAPSSLP